MVPEADSAERPHARAVAAFVTKYYGSGGTAQALSEPLHTVVTRARFGLVTVDLVGEPWALVDIGLRMLSPRELARAQGFGDSFQLVGTQSEQIARIGNSVPPDLAAAVIRANAGPAKSMSEVA
jgi:DNA (cytosine-5)-methyltransferase 1